VQTEFPRNSTLPLLALALALFLFLFTSVVVFAAPIMSVATKPAVVIDNGSGRCKTGMAGEDSPKSVFPAVIGTPKQKVWLCAGFDFPPFPSPCGKLRSTL
jgi:Actin